MTALQRRDVTANGIRIHFAEQGTGPLVLLCHGFPEGWYSWRDQLSALSAAGYHAVAPDMRGYGRTDAPAEISSYNVLDIVGDMIGLVSALDEKQAIIVGHDWGANIAWHAALFRPDVFPAVAALSVPFRRRGPAPPLQMLRKAGQLTHYWFHFQEPGVAEAEFERDPRTTLRRILYSISGDSPPETRTLALQPGKGWFANTLDPENLPAWFTEADLDHMAAEFSRSGFRGGLNWYRNIDRNWELTAPWAGALIRQPALFIAGSEDPVISTGSGAAAVQAMQVTVPGLRRILTIDGAGHFIQQERPQIVNEALVEFLRGLTAWGAGTVDDHYTNHLGPVYTWMVGDIDAALSRSNAEFDAVPLPSKTGGTALDLGAGLGLHAIPLARRGFSVVAIDSYDPLLQELASRRGSLPIRTVNANLLAFRSRVTAPIDVIVCMGDTLTHLPKLSDVESLFAEIAASLGTGGVFVTTFRDYASTPLQGDARFILVRGDEQRILTCFLEYADTTVTVHDQLHQREGGSWRLRVSSYSKLRLSPQWVVEHLSSLGLAVRRDSVPGGMTRITAQKLGA